MTKKMEKSVKSEFHGEVFITASFEPTDAMQKSSDDESAEEVPEPGMYDCTFTFNLEPSEEWTQMFYAPLTGPNSSSYPSKVFVDGDKTGFTAREEQFGKYCNTFQDLIDFANKEYKAKVNPA